MMIYSPIPITWHSESRSICHWEAEKLGGVRGIGHAYLPECKSVTLAMLVGQNGGAKRWIWVELLHPSVLLRRTATEKAPHFQFLVAILGPLKVT